MKALYNLVLFSVCVVVSLQSSIPRPSKIFIDRNKLVMCALYYGVFMAVEYDIFLFSFKSIFKFRQ